MLRKLVLVTAILFGTSFALVKADVDLKKDHRYANREPGYCAWISLKMLGKHHGISELSDIDEQRDKLPKVLFTIYTLHTDPITGANYITIRHETLPDSGANPTSMREHLTKLKLRYTLEEGPKKAMDLLKEYSDKNIGGVAALGDTIEKGFDCPVGNHALLVTGVSDKKVKFIDCNEKDLNHEWDRAQFEKYLMWAVVVDPNKMPQPVKPNWRP